MVISCVDPTSCCVPATYRGSSFIHRYIDLEPIQVVFATVELAVLTDASARTPTLLKRDVHRVRVVVKYVPPCTQPPHRWFIAAFVYVVHVDFGGQHFDELGNHVG